MQSESEMIFDALSRQKEIYLNGVSGIKPVIPTDFHTLENSAQQKMSAEAYAYVAGGAGLESTLINNRNAFNTCCILPRMLNGKQSKNLKVVFLGHEFQNPIFTSPIGVLELVHPKADLAVAEACKETGIPMMVSNQASYSMEAIAKVLNGSTWFFQLYVSKVDALSLSLIKRAERAGAQGIMITLDTTLLGWRNRDLNLAYLPFLKGKGIAQYTSDPVFKKIADEWPEEKSTARINIKTLSHLIDLSRNLPGSFFENIKGRALKSVRAFTQIYTRPDLNWDMIENLKNNTSLPVILKGIQHPEDALKAISTGIDAIYVSNHGGRQVDGAMASLDTLKNIRSHTPMDYPILFDSGIRCGADIMKSKCFGATMIGIGRPYVYALALKGAEGVKELILNLIAELELNMRLAGTSDINELNMDTLGQY